MKYLLGLCIVAGIVLAVTLWEEMLYYAISLVLIVIPIMIYICYNKLQNIEDKIDEMNEKDKSDNNSKEE